MPHAIRLLAPLCGSEASERLAAALARAGRRVLERVPFHGDDLPAVVAPGELVWTVRSLALDSGEFLEADESGNTSWDLGLGRALSAETGGFVVQLLDDHEAGRAGEAVFLSGCTLQARTWGALDGDLQLGPPLTDGERLSTSYVWKLHADRFGQLSGGDDWELRYGKLLAAERWSVSPPGGAFEVASERGFALILLGDLGSGWESLDLATLAPGWRHRVRRTRGLRAPYVELRREGPLDEALVVELSGRFASGSAGIEVPGGGQTYRWVEAYRGAASHRGESVGARDLILALASVGHLVGEGPGQLLGRGDGD